MIERTEDYISLPEGRIFYLSFGNIKNKAPLIVVHGGPGFSHDTLTVLEPLSKKRNLILYDQLGCGRSDRPNNEKLWRLERYVTELNNLINHFNLKEYHLLGHSFGGSIVLEHALKHPTGLRSITLSSALISTKDWLFDTEIRKKELPKQMQMAIEKHEAQNTTNSKEYKIAMKEFNRRFLCRLDPKPTIYQRALENFNHEIYKIMWGPSEFSCSGNLASYERASELNKLNIPTLLLCGDHDEVRQETLKRYIKNLPSTSYLHVFKNSAHNTYLEATEDFIKEINRFLHKVENRIDEN